MSLTFLQTAVQDKRMSFLGSELLQVNVFCAITILLLGVQTIVTRKKRAQQQQNQPQGQTKHRHRISACRCLNVHYATSTPSAAR